MIVRKYVQCRDCNNIFKVRYSVGVNFPQTSTFECSVCNNPIVFGYNSRNDSDLILKGIELLDFDHYYEPVKDIQTINLVQDFLIGSEELKSDHLFGALDHILDSISNGKPEVLSNELININSFINNWKSIKVPLRLLCLNGKDEFKILTKTEYKDFCIIFLNWTSKYFSEFMENEYNGLINDVTKLNTESMNDLEKVIKEEGLLKWIYTIINTYMEEFSTFKTVLINQKTKTPLDNKIITVDWTRIEKIYGDIYEVFGNALVIPTVINNIKEGRAYNEFKKWNWSGYLDSDKSSRCNNFMENMNLNFLANSYENYLRNGTHHKASSYDSENHKIVLNTGKNGKTVKYLSIIDYIKNCNIIFGHYLMMSNIILMIDIEK